MWSRQDHNSSTVSALHLSHTVSVKTVFAESGKGVLETRSTFNTTNVQFTVIMFQDGMFHPPMMSGGGRVAPSPATSAHEEHDSTSNLSWPSTPVSRWLSWCYYISCHSSSLAIPISAFPSFLHSLLQCTYYQNCFILSMCYLFNGHG